MQKKILAIEDEKDILEIIEFILENSGYLVKGSLTFEKIFEKIEEFKPDLILLDIMVFDQDGRLICQAIKENELTKNIPVIMVSAHPDIINTIKNAGADDFIGKPFDIDKLVEKVEKQIGSGGVTDFFYKAV